VSRFHHPLCPCPAPPHFQNQEVEKHYAFSFLDDAHLVLVTWPDELEMGGRDLNKLLVYSLPESLHDPVDVLTPHLEAIFGFPSIVLLDYVCWSYCLCDVKSRALSVGHFYPDVEDDPLSFAVPIRVLDDEIIDGLELHIPRRLLLDHYLTPSGTETAVTAPEVPSYMWGDKVFVNLRTRMPGMCMDGLPSASAGRSVTIKQRLRGPTTTHGALHAHLHVMMGTSLLA